MIGVLLLALATVTFGPNDRTGAFSTVYAGSPRVARCGGCELIAVGVSIGGLSNETTPEPWYNGAPDDAIVGVAYNGSTIEKRWRTMFRFVLRDVTSDRSSIVLGNEPALVSWPLVTSATLHWFNGDAGGQEGGMGAPVTESDLDIYVGRGLYDSPPSENPFGVSSADASSTFGRVTSELTFYDTLTWVEWAGGPLLERVWKSWDLPAGAVSTYLATITGTTNSYLDIAFVSTAEATVGANFKQEIGAWDPNPPYLEVTFGLEALNVSTLRESGSVDTVRDTGKVGTLRESGKAGAVRETGKVGALRESGKVGTVKA